MIFIGLLGLFRFLFYMSSSHLQDALTLWLILNFCLSNRFWWCACTCYFSPFFQREEAPLLPLLFQAKITLWPKHWKSKMMEWVSEDQIPVDLRDDSGAKLTDDLIAGTTPRAGVVPKGALKAAEATIGNAEKAG